MGTVSVIIPNYNHAQFLKQRIDSVLNQTYQDFELIILDDCSSDNSREIIEGYRNHPKIKDIIYNERNSGSTFKQWKKGIEIANNEFIWIAESDDTATANFIETLLPPLQKEKSTKVSFCRTAEISEEGEFICINTWGENIEPEKWEQSFIAQGLKVIKEVFRYYCKIPSASSAIFRRNDAAVINWIADNNMKFCGDWYFWLNLVSTGQISYSPQLLNHQRIHSGTTRVAKNLLSEKIRLLEIVDCVTYGHRLCNQAVRWNDPRLQWVFNYYFLRTTASEKKKIIYFKGFKGSFLLNLFFKTYLNMITAKRIKNYLIRKRKAFRQLNLKKLIGMTSIEEREYWKSVTKNKYKGNGAIVDLGSWFGSTTFSLAEGLANNTIVERQKKKIYAFDLFEWEDWMEPYVKGTQFENFYKPGEDFSGAFKMSTKKYAHFIIHKKADLLIENWKGGDVEILLVDAMKSMELCKAIFKNFYPHLIVGNSYVFHQDFAHYFTYWIHLLHFVVRDYFEVVKDSNVNGSLAFHYKKLIPKEIYNTHLSLSNFDENELNAVFEYSLSLVKDENKGDIYAAKIMAFKDRFGMEKAADLYNEINALDSQHFKIQNFKDLLNLS